MQACSVAKSCLALCNPIDCSPPSSAVHGISQARILEQVAISDRRGSSWPRGGNCVSCIGRQILYHWATWEVHTTSGMWPIQVLLFGSFWNFTFFLNILYHSAWNMQMWRASCTRNSLWMLLNPPPLMPRAIIISLGLDLKEVLPNTYVCLIFFLGFCEDQMRWHI